MSFFYQISTYDFVIGILWICLILFYGVATRIKNKNLEYYDYYLPGLIAKLAGGFAFAMIYVFYYNYQGDTFVYYVDIQTLTNIFRENPMDVLRFMLVPAGSFDPETYYIAQQLNFYNGNDALYVVKIGTLINAFALNSYFGSTILFSFFSFLGVWKMYELFIDYYPNLKQKLAIAVLFIPSVVFWGSSVLKDSIVIGCLGYLLFAINKVLIQRELKLVYILLGVLCAVLVFNIKAYVLLSILPSAAIWVFPTIKSRIKNKALRVFIAPLVLVATIGVASVLIFNLSQINNRFSLDNLLSTAQSFQQWHYLGDNSTRSGRGSSYTLGEYEESTVGILLKVPAAINATLFRPYLWEVHNAVILVAALESLVVTIFTIIVFFGLGFFKVVRVLFNRPFVLMCFVFSLFFAFAVGFTSYNFGALVRYKIPCLPLFVGMLFMLNYEVQLYRKSQRIQLNRRPSNLARNLSVE